MDMLTVLQPLTRARRKTDNGVRLVAVFLYIIQGLSELLLLLSPPL